MRPYRLLSAAGTFAAAAMFLLAANLTAQEQGQDQAPPEPEEEVEIQSLDGHEFETEGGALVVRPIRHGSIVFLWNNLVVYVDPVAPANELEDLPQADVVFITHLHGDHFDPDTLDIVVGEETRALYAPQSVLDSDTMPLELRSRFTPVTPDSSLNNSGIGIETIPAYNTTEDRLQYHPRDRGDVGYVLTFGDLRVYVAGDTEDTEEMRALESIDIAFVPVNLPFTMTPQQAAEAVLEFRPSVVYPYHYGEEVNASDFAAFVEDAAEADIDVRLHHDLWYPPESEDASEPAEEQDDDEESSQQ